MWDCSVIVVLFCFCIVESINVGNVVNSNSSFETTSKPSAMDDFPTFWGGPLPDLLKKVSKFKTSDRDAVVVNGSTSTEDIDSRDDYKEADNTNINSNLEETTPNTDTDANETLVPLESHFGIKDDLDSDLDGYYYGYRDYESEETNNDTERPGANDLDTDKDLYDDYNYYYTENQDFDENNSDREKKGEENKESIPQTTLPPPDKKEYEYSICKENMCEIHGSNRTNRIAAEFASYYVILLILLSSYVYIKQL